MSRCGNIASIMLEHIDWANDAMVITFAKHKGDQTGEGLGNLKHVYANPLNPKFRNRCYISTFSTYMREMQSRLHSCALPHVDFGEMCITTIIGEKVHHISTNLHCLITRTLNKHKSNAEPSCVETKGLFVL